MTIMQLRTLVLLFVLAAGFTACGSDDGVERAETESSPPASESPDVDTDDGSSPEPGRQVTEGYEALEARADLISMQPGTVEEIVVDPTDDRRLLLHFAGAAAPCSGAAVDVTETETSVIIDFRVGLDPNVAAMTCPAGLFDYEIAIPLASPLGDRSINLAG